jgi:hypothetical protein
VLKLKREREKVCVKTCGHNSFIATETKKIVKLNIKRNTITLKNLISSNTLGVRIIFKLNILSKPLQRCVESPLIMNAQFSRVVGAQEG